MAKTIALNIKIQSQGGEKVIKNINELESEIEQLQSELKTLDFGSEAFEEASRNLGVLKAGLRDVDKQLEGVDREQTIQAFGAAINGVTGAFLIASSAARTFGAEAETVEEIQKAEAAALEAVNIALGIQALSEAFLQKEKIKTTALKIKDAVATKAAALGQSLYTAAIGTSTGALKAFRIALISTGIGAVVVAIGALVANWDKLSKAIFGSAEAQSDFNKVNEEALKNIGKQIVDLDFYAGVVNDTTASEYERLEALDKLNEAGVISDDINLDNVESLDLLNQRLELVKKNILLKAQAEAAAALLSEAMKAQIEAQNSTLEENLSWWDKTTNFLVASASGPMSYYKYQQQNITDGILNQQEALEETGEAVERYETLYLDLLAKLNASEAELNKGRKESEQRIERNNRKRKERNDAEAKYVKLLEDLNKQIGIYADKLSEVEFSEEASVKIIEDANELLEQQNELLKERAEVLGVQVGVNDDYTESLRRLVGGIVIPANVTTSINKLDDQFKNIVDSIIKAGTDIDEFNDNLQTFGDPLEQIMMTLQAGLVPGFKELNDEQKSSIISFLKSQDQAKTIIEQFNDATEEYNKNLRNQADAKQLANTQDLEIFNLIVQTNDLLTNRLDNFQTEEEVRAQIEQQVSLQLFQTTELNKLSEEQLKVVQETTDLIYDQATFYGDVLKVSKELDGVISDIGGNIADQAADLTDSEFANLFTKIKEDAEANLPALERFFSTLSAETSNLTQEQLDNINTFLKEFRENLDKEWNNMDWGERIGEIVGQISSLTSQIQGIVQAQISLEFERLEYAQEQTMALIGDESERARELQAEAQQEFNRKRFELEKKARITELNFAVATAIAGGAQAVVNALATPIPPPGPQILAGLYGGLTAIEIATIRDQLNFVKSTQFIARRGGLVSGPSHEMGGVMANGGLVLEGGEFIVNKNAVSQYSDILSSINTSTGGRALGVDDSKLVQEIRKQNQRPIKTYVMYEDIKNTNKINSKLEQISRL